MDDLKTLYHLLITPVRGTTHADRLESFYRPQAEGYDTFRRRLLHGREALFDGLSVDAGQTWVDFGAGTGISLEFMGEKAALFEAIHLVDLSPSLLDVARKRVTTLEFTNVTTHVADATSFVPEGGSVDLITFSYSLTMIPDWYSALENALCLLKPGGRIAIVDFYIARKHAATGRRRHNLFTRHFWPFWFANDNVFLSPDHLPWLEHHFETLRLEEHAGSLPFLPFTQVPYYLFVGTSRV